MRRDKLALAWQGRTPGKRICGLRVINRAGGELADSAGFPADLRPQWSLSPGARVLMLREESGTRHADLARWGLTPAWLKDLSRTPAHARVETRLAKGQGRYLGDLADAVSATAAELAEGRTAKTEDVVSVGDVVTAKCIGIDDKGRVKMSVRAALRDAKAAEAEAAGITE